MIIVVTGSFIFYFIFQYLDEQIDIMIGLSLVLFDLKNFLLMF
jgi:hypothetical protein